ncbi:MAG: hypothetical protein DRI86_05195 [Bacteroidetes bacterium]|nr:MAG: hypothetical protein DRI86_05195 [Bacteroidota bacterium]
MAIRILFLFIFISVFGYAQNDTLRFADRAGVVGELKMLKNGVVTIETDYSDSDFEIEWLKVFEISTDRVYRCIISNGERYYGSISGGKKNGITITDKLRGTIIVKLEDIVYFEHIDEGGFIDVLTINLDFGYSYTKTSNLNQLNGSMQAIYNTNVWGFNINANTVQSSQTDVTPTKRITANAGVKLFLKRSIYGGLDAEYFSNNEQNLDLRSNYKIVIGNYFLRTNRQYLNSNIGLSYTFENYADTLEDRQGIEGNFTVEYNIFNMNDLDFYTSITLYPSLSELGRLRTVIKSNIKYDLPRDFYIKLGLDYNYDTKPVEGAIPDDFVFTAGIGWELK